MKVAEAYIDCRVYEGEKQFMGIAEVSLPEIAQKTITVEGSGLAGGYEAVLTGMFEPMSMNMNFRSLTKDTFSLTTPEEHKIELWALQQERDVSKSVNSRAAVKHIIKGTLKKLSPGKLKTGDASDASGEYSVTYFATFHDGKKMREIDVVNYIYFVDGKDYLKEYREKMGS